MSFHGLHVLSSDVPSCGADIRMLHENWSIRMYPDHALVNHVRWNIVAHEGKEYLLEHKAAPDAYMSMTMEVSPSLAFVTLQGLNEARKYCRDTVVLVRDAL